MTIIEHRRFPNYISQQVGACLWFALLLGICPAANAQERSLDFPVLDLVEGRTSDECLALGGHDVALLGRRDLEVRLQLNFGEVRVAAASIVGAGVLVAGSIDAEQGYLALHSLATGAALWELPALEAPLTCLCATDDCCLVGNELGQVTAFDTGTGASRWAAAWHSKLVTSMVRIDGQLCASGDWVGKIVIFDPSTGKEKSNFQQHRSRVTSLLVNSTTTPVSLVSASRDGTVRLWYPAQRRLVRFVQIGKPVTDIVLAEDGSILAATNDAIVHRVDLQSAKVISRSPAQREYLTTLFPRDQDSLLSSSGLNAVFTLDIAAP